MSTDTTFTVTVTFKRGRYYAVCAAQTASDRDAYTAVRKAASKAYRSRSIPVRDDQIALSSNADGSIYLAQCREDFRFTPPAASQEVNTPKAPVPGDAGNPDRKSQT